MWWRQIVAAPEFRDGIDFLRHKKRPGIATGATAAEKFERATEWNGYQNALTDVEVALTELPKDDSSLDEAPLSGR